MRTQVMPDPQARTAWLEHDPPGGPTERTPLTTLPFQIGRNDTCDLQIKSNQVSREHAVISQQAKKFKVRDLGSTNGTFVNGERIDEATLTDGDLLVIADMEFTFFSGAAGASRQTATQVLAPVAQHAASDPVWETILAVRRAHEVALQGTLRTRFQPIVQIAGGEIYGFEALSTSGCREAAQPRCESWAAETDCRASHRMRRLFRRVAVEDAAELPPGYLFVAITAAEIAEPSLVGHLCQLRTAVGSNRHLVVEIPDTAVRSSADFRTLLSCLRDVHIQVAYDNFASGKARLTEHKDVVPDYLKLAPALLRGIHSGADRQRQVQLIVRAGHDLGCAVVATGIDSQVDLEVCRDLGCVLGQGTHLGMPQAVASHAQTPRSATPVRELVK